MTYDQWKTTDPNDERYQPAPCDEKPYYDENDICKYCGANPMQECQWTKP